MGGGGDWDENRESRGVNERRGDNGITAWSGGGRKEIEQWK